MRIREFISISVLLLAGAAQAVNTEVPLSVQSQQGLLGHVETAAAPRESQDVSNLLDGALQQALDAYPDLSRAARVDPTASLTQGDDPAGPSAGSLVDGVSGAASWAADRHWSTDPKRYTDAGFVNAHSRVSLPAFAEVDWVPTPLPTERRASLMELFVFPALGALVVVFLLVLLIVRLRRRRSLNHIVPLLRV